jgi:hypothetical protein
MMRLVPTVLLEALAVTADQAMAAIVIVTAVVVLLLAVRCEVLALAVVADEVIAALPVVVAVVVDLLADLAALVLVAAEETVAAVILVLAVVALFLAGFDTGAAVANPAVTTLLIATAAADHRVVAVAAILRAVREGAADTLATRLGDAVAGEIAATILVLDARLANRALVADTANALTIDALAAAALIIGAASTDRRVVAVAAVVRAVGEGAANSGSTAIRHTGAGQAATAVLTFDTGGTRRTSLTDTFDTLAIDTLAITALIIGAAATNHVVIAVVAFRTVLERAADAFAARISVMAIAGQGTTAVLVLDARLADCTGLSDTTNTLAAFTSAIATFVIGAAAADLVVVTVIAVGAILERAANPGTAAIWYTGAGQPRAAIELFTRITGPPCSVDAGRLTEFRSACPVLTDPTIAAGTIVAAAASHPGIAVAAVVRAILVGAADTRATAARHA